MNIKSTIQGFAIGAALMAGTMLGVPALVHAQADTNQYAAIADSFGLSITWQKNVDCEGDRTVWGCFNPATPSTIYVKTGLNADDTRYVVLHEIGHASQNRLGVEMSECNADEFARSLGGYRSIGRC